MKDFQGRRKLKQIYYSWPALILLSAVLVFLTISVVKVYFKYRIASQKAEETQKELAELEQRKADLQNNLQRLQSESGLDEEIRKKFNVAKPGEKVLIVVDKNKENDKISGEETSVGFFGGIWKWLSE